MGRTNAREALALLISALLGLGAGLLYDLLRPPRRAAKHFPAALLDLLYVLSVGAGLFLYAMSAGDGRLGQWELAAALLGFLLYLHLLSPWILPLIEAAARFAGKSLETLGNPVKKFLLKQKKFFKKLKDCYIMRR